MIKRQNICFEIFKSLIEYFNIPTIIYSKENKPLYYFKDKEVLQNTLRNECQIFRYYNDLKEKNFNDRAKQIILQDEKIKNILSNG